jgi:hypothetical protein
VLGEFEAIEGTHFLAAPIRPMISNTPGYRLTGRISSWGIVYNVVFLNRANGTFQQLLPTNEYVIAGMKPLVTPAPKAEPPITHAWLYSVIKSDTNGDKELTLEDKITVSISDVGGATYREMVTDVDEVYGDTLRDETTLLIVYRRDKLKYLASIDISGYSIITTTELPSLGSDVK